MLACTRVFQKFLHGKAVKAYLVSAADGEAEPGVALLQRDLQLGLAGDGRVPQPYRPHHPDVDPVVVLEPVEAHVRHVRHICRRSHVHRRRRGFSRDLWTRKNKKQLRLFSSAFDWFTSRYKLTNLIWTIVRCEIRQSLDTHFDERRSKLYIRMRARRTNNLPLWAGPRFEHSWTWWARRMPATPWAMYRPVPTYPPASCSAMRMDQKLSGGAAARGSCSSSAEAEAPASSSPKDTARSHTGSSHSAARAAALSHLNLFHKK